MMGKRWWRSRTIVANLIALGAVIVQSQTGYVLSPEVQGALLTVLNVLLRFRTDEPIQGKNGHVVIE